MTLSELIKRLRGVQLNGETDDAYHSRLMEQHRSQAISNSVGRTISSVGDKIINLEKTRMMSELNIAKAKYAQQADILKSKLTSLNVQISKTLGAGLNIFTKTANEAAYASGRSIQEISKANIKNVLEIQNILRKTNVSIKNAQLDLRKAELELWNEGVNAAGQAVSTIGSVFSGVGGTIAGAIANGLAAGIQLENKRAIMQKTMEVEYLKFEQEQYQQAYDIIQTQIDTVSGYLEPFISLTEEIDKFAGKFDTATRKFAATIGYNGEKGKEFADFYRTAAVEVAKTFGASAEEIQKLQESYISASTRAVNMSLNDMLGTMATSRLFGISPTETGELFGEMNIFNTSIASGTDMMGDMYKTITKMGLSSTKFGKELVNNLKLAQKYNFKGGVENMMKITKWAQQTRFNLNSAASFSDSLMNGNLSDVLEKSAKLQVLGGSAAMYSDPLGMLYDAGADVGNMAQRMAAMFNDITGTFNRKTGETEFSWYENRMLAARAQAMGMDVGEVRNMIRQQNKQGVINRALRNSGLDKDSKIAIGNRATYDKKNKRWVVTDIRGNVHDINEYRKGGPGKIEDLLPENNEEALLKVAENSLGVEEKMKNLQEHILFALSKSQWADYVLNTEKRMEIQKQTYLDDSSNINYISSKFRDFDTKALKVISDNLEILTGSDGQKMITDYMTFSLENAGINEDSFSVLVSDIEKIKNDVNSLASEIVRRLKGTVNIEDLNNLNGPILIGFDNENKSGDLYNKQLYTSDGRILDEESMKKYYEEKFKIKGTQENINKYDFFEGQNGEIYRLEVEHRSKDGTASYGNMQQFNPETGKYKNLTSSTFKKNKERLKGATQISDGFVDKSGKVTKIDSEDNAFFFKKNGAFGEFIREILNISNSNGGVMKHEFSGHIYVTSDGSTVDIAELLNKPEIWNNIIIPALKKTNGINTNGKPQAGLY